MISSTLRTEQAPSRISMLQPAAWTLIGWPVQPASNLVECLAAYEGPILRSSTTISLTQARDQAVAVKRWHRLPKRRCARPPQQSVGLSHSADYPKPIERVAHR